LENVDEGTVHSEQNVYTEYADPKHSEWITKIQPTLKKVKLACSSKRAENDCRVGRLLNWGWQEKAASEDTRIARIDS